MWLLIVSHSVVSRQVCKYHTYLSELELAGMKDDLKPRTEYP